MGCESRIASPSEAGLARGSVVANGNNTGQLLTTLYLAWPAGLLQKQPGLPVSLHVLRQPVPAALRGGSRRSSARFGRRRSVGGGPVPNPAGCSRLPPAVRRTGPGIIPICSVSATRGNEHFPCVTFSFGGRTAIVPRRCFGRHHVFPVLYHSEASLISSSDGPQCVGRDVFSGTFGVDQQQPDFSIAKLVKIR